jgi:hypothetical protein
MSDAQNPLVIPSSSISIYRMHPGVRDKMLDTKVYEVKNRDEPCRESAGKESEMAQWGLFPRLGQINPDQIISPVGHRSRKI